MKVLAERVLTLEFVVDVMVDLLERHELMTREEIQLEVLKRAQEAEEADDKNL